MTVCVATISGNGRIITGASDQMMTAGDIEFEPPQLKVSSVTNSIVFMYAGDASLQQEVFDDTRAVVSARIQNRPNEWVSVEFVADLYRRCYANAKQRRIEGRLLIPLGLTTETFVTRQRELSPSLVKDLSAEMINFTMPTIETIIAGVDNSGAHLWSALDGEVWCQDQVGFAAVGVGQNHANSQLMMAKFTKWMEHADGAFLTFLAKKRSEIAPGVGTETDMFMIGPDPGTAQIILPSVISKFGAIYARLQRRESTAFKTILGQARTYVASLEAKEPEPQSTEEIGAESASAAITADEPAGKATEATQAERTEVG